MNEDQDTTTMERPKRKYTRRSTVDTDKKEARADGKAEKLSAAGRTGAPLAVRAPYKPRAKKSAPSWHQQFKDRIAQLKQDRKPKAKRYGRKAKKQAKGPKPARRIKGNPSPIFAGLSQLVSVIVDRKLPKGVSWPGVVIALQGLAAWAAVILLVVR